MKSGLLVNLLSTAVLAALSSAAFAGEIAIDVAPAAKASAAGDSVIVTLTNTSESPVYLLKWNTPLGEITEDLFDVRLNGERVRYTGKLVKRTYPTASDYVELMPGKSLSGNVELSGVYDMYRSGEYTVRFDGEFQDTISLGDAKRAMAPFVEASSRAINLSVKGTGHSAFANTSFNFGKAVSYASCSSSRQSSLTTAHASAITYATESASYFSTYTSTTATARYRTWFGTPSTTRFSTVKSHYTKIRDALNNASVVYDCSCTDSYFAYVYANAPYRIYLCNAFWSASNTGTDSRAGTIVHEMSHFTVNGGTDDHVYGQTGAKSLANSNPKKAVDNADSHEYFSENTPAQN